LNSFGHGKLLVTQEGVLQALPDGSLGVPVVRVAGVAPLYFINQQLDFML